MTKSSLRKVALGSLLALLVVIMANGAFAWFQYQRISDLSAQLSMLQTQSESSSIPLSTSDDSATDRSSRSEPSEHDVSTALDMGSKSCDCVNMIPDVVEMVQNSVVSVVETKEISVYQRRSPFSSDPFFRRMFPEFEYYFPEQEENENSEDRQTIQTGGGSGFLISEDGLVMTNRHVVSDEDADYTIILHDGTELSATVLARDPFQDIAVLQVEAAEGAQLPELVSLEFADTESIRVGEQVIAIGNALGEFEHTVTNGIVSGLGRDIVASGRNFRDEQLRGLIQTDAAINPGNSGGPLVNLQGQVLGMNTATASYADGISFAIPASTLRTIAASVEKNGKISYPFLGVRYLMLDEESAEELELEIERGALLIGDRTGFAVVTNSPADDAGLRERDVIVAIDGEEITAETDLRFLISQKEVYREVTLRIWRDGQEQDIVVVLEEMEQ